MILIFKNLKEQLEKSIKYFFKNKKSKKNINNLKSLNKFNKKKNKKRENAFFYGNCNKNEFESTRIFPMLAS